MKRDEQIEDAKDQRVRRETDVYSHIYMLTERLAQKSHRYL